MVDARKWLASQFLDQDTADYLRGILPELQGRKEELSDEEVQEWEHDIATRLPKGKEEGIEKMLRDYRGLYGLFSYRVRSVPTRGRPYFTSIARHRMRRKSTTRRR